MGWRCWKGADDGVGLCERLAEDDVRNTSVAVIRTMCHRSGAFMLFYLMYTGLHQVEMSAPADPEYGWFLFGNESFNSPYVIEMGWINQSAIEPAVWTPPPGAPVAPPHDRRRTTRASELRA